MMFLWSGSDYFAIPTYITVTLHSPLKLGLRGVLIAIDTFTILPSVKEHAIGNSCAFTITDTN